MIVVQRTIRMKRSAVATISARQNNSSVKVINFVFQSSFSVVRTIKNITRILLRIDKYITPDFLPDGTINCDDGSDEINCMSSICSFGACSQICLEKKSGNFNCRCADGYSKGLNKNDTCSSNEEPLLLIASDRDLRYLLPVKQMDTEVHGRIALSKSKIDVFDVQILSDTVYLFWITTPNRVIQRLATTTFNSNFKRKTKRAAEPEATTIISSIQNPKSLAIDWVNC